MNKQLRLLPCLAAITFLLLLTDFHLSLGQETSEGDSQLKWGHSHLGSVYDEGPRSRPWVMEGIGETHFPVTSANPEVQQWYDQAHTLLHGFWYFEAERSFRWCLKLDPECAMAYWGLARCSEMDPKRSAEFLKEALARRDKVSEREQAYLDVWQAKAEVQKADGEDAKQKAIQHYAELFDQLLIDHPGDMEARTLYWLEMPRLLGEGDPEAALPSRYAMEMVLQEVLTKQPTHVGALHYRIHNWDTSYGLVALDSCSLLSEVAPKCGHLQHMPGHVLSGVGLWNSAAIAMDSATRVENEYMKERMILPEQNWNYTHNLDYLCYIQEQLGMYETALENVKQLVSMPAIESRPLMQSFIKSTAMRLLVKYEKWDEILDADSDWLRWNTENPMEKVLRLRAEAKAHLGKGNLEPARSKIAELKAVGNSNGKQGPQAGPADDNASAANANGPPAEFVKEKVKSWINELEALEKIASGDGLTGFSMLTEAAKSQADTWDNDPPREQLIFNTLGEAYLKAGAPKLAVSAFSEALEIVTSDAFALSGLVRAHAALGEMEEAAIALGKLTHVWSVDDVDNRWLRAAMETGIQPQSSDEDLTLSDHRDYRREVLDRLGPTYWTPPVAPQFHATDSKGTVKALGDFKGKNVILIFYLGGSCLHCMEQLKVANEHGDKLSDLNTEVVAISRDGLDAIKEYEASEGSKITLLSDPSFESARVFKSFDDFEEIELHSTFLIDKQGRVRWMQRGGDPFMNFDFLESEAKRLESED